MYHQRPPGFAGTLNQSWLISRRPPWSSRLPGRRQLRTRRTLVCLKGKHGKLLNLAAKAANSWNDEVVKACVEKLKIARSAAVLAEESEYWTINRAVHFNEWANFSKAGFIPVLAAWKQFLALFSCENSSCESLIYVVSNNGNEEALRCKCGSFNLNLRIK